MTTGLRDLTSVLRHREFRLLWTAQSLSVLGDQIITVALALFVTELTGSVTDLGLVLAAHTLPLVGFILIGGVWADRLPRHRVVVVTDLARFALHALLAILIVAGDVQIWQVIVIEALFGTAEAFFRPASAALVPQTVPEAEIQQANALTTMSNNVGEFIGPALATLLVLGVGAGAAFALDAATFIVSAAVIIRLRPRRRGADEPAAPAAGLARRAARRLPRGPLADLGLGHPGLVLRRGVHRPRALVRARAADRHRAVRRASPSTAPSRPCSAPARSSARWSGSAGARATRCGWR